MRRGKIIIISTSTVPSIHGLRCLWQNNFPLRDFSTFILLAWKLWCIWQQHNTKRSKPTYKNKTHVFVSTSRFILFAIYKCTVNLFVPIRGNLKKRELKGGKERILNIRITFGGNIIFLYTAGILQSQFRPTFHL